MSTWSAGTHIFVRERGTRQYREILLENNIKTLTNLYSLAQNALSPNSSGYSLQVSSISKEDGSRIESDLDVCFISEGQTLEVVFAGKFYWVVTDEQRNAWTNEFINTVGPGQTRMTGDQAKQIFTASRVSMQELAAIWDLADVDKDSYLNVIEYILARFLIYARQQGQTIPSPLPQTLIDTVAQAPQIPPPRSSSLPNSKKSKSRLNINNNHNHDSSWTISKKKISSYTQLFMENCDGGFVTGSIAKDLFRRSGIDRMTLARIWSLADIDKDSALNRTEFKIAMHLIGHSMKGNELPETLPVELLTSAQKLSGHVRNSSTPQRPLPAQHMINQTPFVQVTPAPSIIPYQRPNLIPPNQPVNIGQWNFDQKNKQHHDIIQNIAANIRGNLVQKIPPSQPSSPTLPSSQILGDAEKQIAGVVKIDSSTMHRETLLGGGTFGSVWRGTCSGEVVAIKDMSYSSPKEIDMWKREVQLLSYLQHENFLVKLKGYCITPEHLTIIMEFMDGGSLYEVIHKRQKVTWSMLQKTRILRHISKAIESIHKLNVVHRDIKSMNILLDRNGTAKLADLGCSRAVRGETMTVGVGSPLWMAPEVSNSSNYSFPSDIFSYGVVIYEVFNEKLPEYDTAARRVVISSECIGYSIIKECTRTIPDERPTASQIIDSLDLLITTFTNTVARVVLKSYTGDRSELPREEDVHGWYNVLLSYDRETFDVLLSSGLNGQ